jgi:hypothetical protein
MTDDRGFRDHPVLYAVLLVATVFFTLDDLAFTAQFYGYSAPFPGLTSFMSAVPLWIQAAVELLWIVALIVLLVGGRAEKKLERRLERRREHRLRKQQRAGGALGGVLLLIFLVLLVVFLFDVLHVNFGTLCSGFFGFFGQACP